MGPKLRVLSIGDITGSGYWSPSTERFSRFLAVSGEIGDPIPGDTLSTRLLLSLPAGDLPTAKSPNWRSKRSTWAYAIGPPSACSSAILKT